MKTIVIAMVISFLAFSSAFAQDSKNDPQYRIDSLGSVYGAFIQSPGADWYASRVVDSFATKSATAAELYAFLHVEKNMRACTKKLGNPFVILAIEHGGITDIVVKDNAIISQTSISKNSTDLYFFNDMHYLRKIKE